MSSVTKATYIRRFPVGAEICEEGVDFRVWAPGRRRVAVLLVGPPQRGEIELQPDEQGYFRGTVAGIGAGTRYRFRLDDEPQAYPDPASRFQPEGPHGPSEVVAPRGYRWNDAGWSGVERAGQVVYELHIGTFSPEGTWQGAERQLGDLADLGVTLVEVMPVADFSGEFGWGYDGVNLFAPTRLYGTPDEFRRFVDRAHGLGLGVILDVVYNHLGPDGNYLGMFSEHYFTDRYHTPWGAAINYDGEQSAAVREWVVTNAAYWIEEFHLDGLRLDSTQDIHDASAEHVLTAATRAARQAAGQRSLFIVAENQPQDVRHLREPAAGGFGMDGMWSDDFHHSAFAALTGNHQAYCCDFRGTPQEFISLLKRGFLFQGQWSQWGRARRGTSALKLPLASRVVFLENHDQVANTGLGLRRHQQSHPGTYRALTALMLLGPTTPMLFQGQEYGSTAPFTFFASHPPELAKLVDEGRKESLATFPNLATPEMQALIPRPSARETFLRCKLDWSERERYPRTLALHRDLLQLRRSDPVLAAQSGDLDGAVLGEQAFLIRFFDAYQGDRLLLVNLGSCLELQPLPEPLLAEPEGCAWQVAWSSEDPRYGGEGTGVIDCDDRWVLPAHAAVLLKAVRSSSSEPQESPHG